MKPQRRIELLAPKLRPLLLSALVLSAGCGGGEDPPVSPPTPSSFSIGGSVSGLVGAGLRLYNNGGDALNISGDGAFSFATRVPSGATYSVTVAEQPSGQSCTVSDGSGAAKAEVTSVSVSCSNTSPPALPAIALLTGTYGGRGYADGPVTVARFDGPAAVAVDPQGIRYVADASNRVIRRIGPDGVVTTIAGSPGMAGDADGVGPAARFRLPVGLALDEGGALFVADYEAHTVRRIQLATGEVTTVAGKSGVPGTSASPARLRAPMALAFADGQLLIADSGNHALRRLLAADVVLPFAGTVGQKGPAEELGTDAALAHFDTPSAITVNPQTGQVLVLDTGNCVVRAISNAIVQTLVGKNGDCRSVDGARETARLNFRTFDLSSLNRLAFDAATGRTFVGDVSGLREINIFGAARTIQVSTSSGQASAAGGQGAIAVDSQNRLLVAGTQAIAELQITGDTTAIVQTFAGQPPGTGVPAIPGAQQAWGAHMEAQGGLLIAGPGGVQGVSQSGDVQALIPIDPQTQLGVASVAQATDGMLYAATWRALVSATDPMASVNGYRNGSLQFSVNSASFQDGYDAAPIYFPLALDVDHLGRAVIADAAGVIRRVDQAGMVTLVAGRVGEFGNAVGDALESARFFEPRDVAVGQNGDIFVLDIADAEATGGRILKISPTDGRDKVSLVVDGLDNPGALAVDEAGNMYVAESSQCVILRIRPSGARSVIAGQSGRCTFEAGALPGSLPLTSIGGGNLKVRGKRLLVVAEGAIVQVTPLLD